MKKYIALFIAFFCVFSLKSQIQHSTSVNEQYYTEGECLFERGHYNAARQSLMRYLNQTDDSGKGLRREKTEYMIVCAAYELKETDAAELLKGYLLKYPMTPHSNRLNTLLGNLLYETGEYETALKQYAQCNLDKLNNKERDEATLNKAISLLNLGERTEAYTLFSVLQMCSEEYAEEALYYKAYIDYTLQRFEEAIPSFDVLRKEGRFQNESTNYLADICLQKKEYEKAIELAESYLLTCSSGSAIADMQRICGEAYYGMGNWEKATHMLTLYVEGCGHPQRNALYKLGLCHFNQRAYSSAAKLLTQTTSENDALSQNAYLHSGLSYVQLRDMSKARLAFEQASSMDFNRAIKEQAMYNYALCIHETSYSGFGESVNAFERFLNEFPQSLYASQVNDYLVEVYMSTRSYKTALASIAKIQQPGKRILEAKQKIYYRLGVESFANSDFSESESWLNQSLQMSSFDRKTKINAYFWRGEARYKQNNFRGAAADYLQYIDSPLAETEYKAFAYYNLGYTDFQQKNYVKALEYFNMANQYTKYISQPIQADINNRVGDCHFYSRHFQEALESYNKAVTIEPGMGDYSYYQIGFIEGLQKNYLGKIATLEKLIQQYPQSQYVDDALYEQGRAYVQQERNSQAIVTFDKLLKVYPESPFARKAANEIGLLYYQDDRYDEAIAAYKRVIADYAGSEEARLASRDLKSIYVDLNRVDEYASYVSSLKGSIRFDSNERDSLTYVAAEKIYMRGDIQEAESSLKHYLQVFPEGAFSLHAHYYLGVIGYKTGNSLAALEHMGKVLEYPNNKFSEEALVISAELSYNGKDYARALDLYKLLKGKTASTERLLLARTGILRAAYMIGDYTETSVMTNELLTEPKTSVELANEARYYRAKLAATNGHREQAASDLQELAKDTRHIYGAEAKYRLAEMYFAADNVTQAEQELLNYIEVSTPHSYWLARSFVLLADVYIKTGRELEAKQYLLSLQQNYTEKDDIEAMIQERLAKIK